jgi:hypothetical protein
MRYPVVDAARGPARTASNPTTRAWGTADYTSPAGDQPPDGLRATYFFFRTPPPTPIADGAGVPDLTGVQRRTTPMIMPCLT